MAYYSPPPEEKELLYDLRQAFVIITTEIKKEIVLARTNKEFPRWYSLLDSLFIEISKNLTDTEVEQYEKLNLQVLEILNKHSASFMMKSSTNANEIYSALRTLDLWLNRKMNEKNMYGSRDSDDGL